MLQLELDKNSRNLLKSDPLGGTKAKNEATFSNHARDGILAFLRSHLKTMSQGMWIPTTGVWMPLL